MTLLEDIWQKTSIISRIGLLQKNQGFIQYTIKTNCVMLTKGKFICYTMAEIREMQWYQDIFDRPPDALN